MDRLIGWLLNLVYLMLLLMVTPVLIWQHLSGRKRRRQWRQRLFGPDLPASRCLSDPAGGGAGKASAAAGEAVVEAAGKATGAAGPVLWTHAVSVGEVNLALGLLPHLIARFPDFQMALSASTDTGLELAQRRFPVVAGSAGRTVFRFPFDFSWAMSRIFRQLQPAALVLTELEIWPNLIAAAVRRQVPVLVVNGRLSESSFRNYQRFSWLVGRWFRSLDLVVAQTEDYARRFRQLGVAEDRIVVSGSIKFDAACTDRGNPSTMRLRQLAGMNSSDQIIWLAGSTSAPEEGMVLEVYLQVRQQLPDLKLILVPRHQERFEEVAGLCEAVLGSQEISWLRRSALPESGIDSKDWDVLLVDTIGELSSWWGVAEIGMVGGSFGVRGGQSMIEPAAFGVATCYGPNTSNFRDVVALMNHSGAGKTVADGQELLDFVLQMGRDSAARKQMGQKARQLVEEQSGATERTLTAMERLFAGSGKVPGRRSDP